jgi:hypothetical protein
MHLVLDEYRAVSLVAVRQYVEKYPNDQVENHRAFLLCWAADSWKEMWVPIMVDVGHPQCMHINCRQNIVDVMGGDHNLSTRRVSARHGASHCCVSNIMWAIVLPADTNAWPVFCQWLLHQYAEDPIILTRLLRQMSAASQGMDGINKFL